MSGGRPLLFDMFRFGVSEAHCGKANRAHSYLICLTLGPAFLSGAIYLCLSRVVVAYGTHLSRLSPRAYAFIFMSSDFLSLVLQGAGGGITATAGLGDDSQHNLGVHIMVAGLVFQVVSLALYMVLCLDFAWKVKKSYANRNPQFAVVRDTRLFMGFLFGT